jgi:hypothetical protein
VYSSHEREGEILNLTTLKIGVFVGINLTLANSWARVLGYCARQFSMQHWDNIWAVASRLCGLGWVMIAAFGTIWFLNRRELKAGCDKGCIAANLAIGSAAFFNLVALAATAPFAFVPVVRKSGQRLGRNSAGRYGASR